MDERFGSIREMKKNFILNNRPLKYLNLVYSLFDIVEVKTNILKVVFALVYAQSNVPIQSNWTDKI